MRILVTGASGILGHRVAQALVRHGHAIVLTSSTGKVHDAPGPVETCDLTDDKQVEDLVAIFAPDAIVHCAGLADADACQEDRAKAWTLNVGMTAHLAHAAKRRDTHLVLLSTDHVFEGTEGPYAEDAIGHPVNEYGLSKLGAERSVATLTRTWSIARTAVLLGWPARGRSNFGAWLIEQLSKKKPVKLFEDQLVTPSLASHVALQLVELVERRLTGKWHLCGAETLDRFSFGRAFAQTFGFDASLLEPSSAKQGGFRSPRPLRAGLKSDKAARQLNTKPLPLAQTLEGLLAEYQHR